MDLNDKYPENFKPLTKYRVFIKDHYNLVKGTKEERLAILREFWDHFVTKNQEIMKYYDICESLEKYRFIIKYFDLYTTQYMGEFLPKIPKTAFHIYS